MSGIDPARVAAEVGHRLPHGREVDHGGHAGEVLEEHSSRGERDLARRSRARVPACDRLDVVRRDVDAVLPAQHVLEEDPQRVGEVRDVVAERREPEDLVASCRSTVSVPRAPKESGWVMVLLSRLLERMFLTSERSCLSTIQCS